MIEQLTLIVLVFVTALYAIFTYEQSEASKKMVEEMKLQRQAQIMPSIVIYFDNPVSNLIELVIKNIGQGVARNASFSITPPLIDYKNRDISELSLFKIGVNYFPPGREYRQVIDTSLKFFNEDAKYPLSYEVTMSYSDIEENQIYNQVIPLDLSVYRHLKTHRESDIDSLTKEISKLVEALKSYQLKG